MEWHHLTDDFHRVADNSNIGGGGGILRNVRHSLVSIDFLSTLAYGGGWRRMHSITAVESSTATGMSNTS
jgi:hypothetical protein